MSDSSSVQLYYAAEAIWGLDPTTKSPLYQLKEFRQTGESLAKTTQTAVSEEIVADRQVKDIVRVAVGSGGDVGTELSYGAHDDLIQGAMMDTWTNTLNVLGVTITISNVSPLNQIVISGSPLPLKNQRVGSYLWVTGSGVGNDGFYLITALNTTTGVATVSPKFTATESANAALRVRCSHIKNGVTKRSFLLEKQFTDLSPVQAHYFPGCRVGQWGLNIAPGAILTGSFTFLGKNGFSRNQTSGNGNPTPASTGDVGNAVDNISNVRYNNAASVFNLTQVAFQIANGLREQPAVANLANIGIGLGRIQLTGTINAYFESRALMDDYLNYTETDLAFAIVIGTQAYHIFIPAMKFTNGRVLAEGNDQDVLAQMEFTARKDPVYGFTIGIGRYA